MNSRRKLVSIIGASLLASPFRSIAQPNKLRRIGFLASGARPSSLNSENLGNFNRGMRELGYVEGRDYVTEWRFAEGNRENFTSMSAELVRLKMDVIVAATADGIEIALRATDTIPIVMVAMADPVKAGFTTSLARPSRNATGLSNQSMDTLSKHAELLRAAIPGLESITMIGNAASPTMPIYVKLIQNSANKLGIEIQTLGVRSPADIEAGLVGLTRARTGALIVTPNALLSAQAGKIIELTSKNRLPTMFWTREHVESGALMSYGQDNAEHYYRAAAYVDKLLKGAKPGDLPIELAARIELVINRKIAKAIGLTIPMDLMIRADKVID